MIRLLGEKFEISQWIMNQASNTSGTTNTTITLLDTSSASFSMGGRSSIHSNGSIGSSNQADPSISSTPTTTPAPQMSNKVFNYKDNTDTDFGNSLKCEDICLSVCRHLKILPPTRLLFGLRVMDSENEWAAPGKELKPGVRYCFRMRIKVPNMDTQLKNLDKQAYEYLYWQIRYDILNEKIPEIRNPEKKDNVMGFAVMHMCIDLQAKSSEAERKEGYNREIIGNIENKYKEYLPQTLLREHRYFVKSKICAKFKDVREKDILFTEFKFYYIADVCKLAPNYLMEVYFVTVDYIPNVDLISVHSPAICNDGNVDNKTRVYVKLDTHDNPEPGLKISLKQEKWTLLAKIEDIFAIYIEDNVCACLEITGLPQSYCMRFKSKVELESFITYIGGYLRLTSKWLKDLCSDYTTPSLNELIDLKCHGPIGGAFSFAKLREKSKKGSTCLIRQCEREYDVYYIDINTQTSAKGRFGENIITTKITLQNKKWLLHGGEGLKEFETLKDLKNSISPQMPWIPPSEYDYAPLLLICLPKNLHPKKTDTELSEAELRRRRVQILDRKHDLRWYKNTQYVCDDAKMMIMQGDWVQEGSCKDVNVMLKVFFPEINLKDITCLTSICSQVFSAQFLKLYGLTLTTPYTMVMEYAPYGNLDKFLRKHKDKISFQMLISIVFDLVRGIVYLSEKGIYHGSIRCSNMYVTKFDPRSHIIETKIGDPGLRRSYSNEDLPWIPQEYYNNLKGVHGDMYVDAWAFATTLWEIFSYGKSPLEELNCTGNPKKIAEKLQMNRSKRDGGILPKPTENLDDSIYCIMLDGWQSDAHKRFNYIKIFAIINGFKERRTVNYESVNIDKSYYDSDTCSENNENSGDDISLDSCPGPSPAQNQRFSHFDMSFNSPFDDTTFVIPFSEGKVIVDKRIGDGHYGIVYSGIIYYKKPDKAPEKVAVKTLKPEMATNIKDFLRESEIMRGLEHENIVKIKYSIEKPICIIMEFVSGGSFNVYLRSQRPNLTNKRLLHFAHDIAKGMNYLAEKKIIHRDLATRNILIEKDRVKISDFGLAQLANSEGYYFVQNQRDIPIKWYSPESIAEDKYSVYSDVWSFGVTMFETFSRGDIPNLAGNRELSQIEFLERLQKGERLQKPELCSQIIYDKLMLPCWKREPKSRPDFAKILDIIQLIVEEDGETI
ncbi:tyrosine-protein kinase hopscotch [Bactrocera neohumeralis]|uniref:tyrosine-protein kinase hopscotch n=1 Tax=Bactrocera neohumeralis TaxID=98809 RepID=UPI002166AABD|nr:tyrosine-protein kinase hopscotch [Bactrocera neohumeralis]